MKTHELTAEDVVRAERERERERDRERDGKNIINACSRTGEYNTPGDNDSGIAYLRTHAVSADRRAICGNTSSTSLSGDRQTTGSSRKYNFSPSGSSDRAGDEDLQYR